MEKKKPCDHPGCASHVSHPCEVCGYQAPMTATEVNERMKDQRNRDPECIGPPCFGYMLKGSMYESRKCDKCCVMGECTDRTKEFTMKKKPLDTKWTAELMSYIIGPQMTILMMKSPKSAKNLTEILQHALADLYAKNDYADTNAWVVAASNRLYELYNTYMTVRLIELFDKGVPDKPLIMVPGGKKIH